MLKGHERYNHRHFPVGRNIPSQVYKTEIVFNDTDKVLELAVTLKYGPFKLKKYAPGRGPSLFLIRRKLMRVYYIIDDIYQIINMLVSYKFSSKDMDIPNIDTSSEDGEEKMFKHLQKVIKNTLIKNNTTVFVDTEGYAFTVGTKYSNYIIAKGGTKIKINPRKK